MKRRKRRVLPAIHSRCRLRGRCGARPQPEQGDPRRHPHPGKEPPGGAAAGAHRRRGRYPGAGPSRAAARREAWGGGGSWRDAAGHKAATNRAAGKRSGTEAPGPPAALLPSTPLTSAWSRSQFRSRPAPGGTGRRLHLGRAGPGRGLQGAWSRGGRGLDEGRGLEGAWSPPGASRVGVPAAPRPARRHRGPWGCRPPAGRELCRLPPPPRPGTGGWELRTAGTGRCRGPALPARVTTRTGHY